MRRLLLVLCALGLFVPAIAAVATTSAGQPAGSAPSSFPAPSPPGSTGTPTTVTGTPAPPVHRPSPSHRVRNLAAFELAGPVNLQWTNPRGTDRVLGRYTRGRTAPATTGDGRPMGLARLAHTATLRGLRPGTVYAVAIWTKHAGVLSSPTAISFTTKPATGPAATTPTGTISGLVTDTSGHPLRNAAIESYAHGASHTVTDARGRFRLTVPAGRSFLFADGAKAQGGDADATGYQGGSRTVHLAPGGAATEDFVLAAGGAVHGVVTDAAGAPLPGIAVTWQPPQPYLEPSFAYGSVLFAGMESTRTNRNGEYTLKGLGSDGVVPCFEPRAGHVARCAPQAVAVAPGQTATIPAVALTAVHEGTIAGTVRTQSKGRLRDLVVYAYRISANNFVTVNATAHHGRFTLAGLTPGRWRVCAYGVVDLVLGVLPTCVHRTVVADHTARVALLLRNGGAISGRVLGPTGHGLRAPSIDVEHVRANGSDGGSYAQENRRGFFTVGGLATGNYRVCFAGSNSSASAGDPTGVGTRCLSRLIRVVAGRDRLGADGTVPTGGAASGRITNSAGRPVAGANVNFELLAEGFSFHQVTTGRDGRYRVTSLPPGRYRVCADNFRSLYGTDQQRCAAHPVTITRGHTHRGIDLRFGSSPIVRVTVTDSSGNPLSGVEVAALRPCADRYDCAPQPVFGPKRVAVDSVAMTNARGRATLRTKRAGRFAVCALGYYAATPTGTSPTGYADKCTGSTFTVTASADTPTAVTVALPAGGVVTGRVTDGHGHGVRHAQIHLAGSPVDDIAASPFAYEGLGDFPSPYADDLTDAHGRYTIHSIRPGQAQLCARGAKGFHNGCLASDVTVSGGAVTNAPALVLQPGTASSRAARSTRVHRPTWRVTVIDGQVVDRRPIRPLSEAPGRSRTPG